jgi:hypothetical protein
MSSQTEVTPQPVVRWRSIALPVEHGGWGFTFEPIVLGLLVAQSASAWELSIAALAVFLARRPFKLVATDVVRRRWLPRSRVAAGFTAIYALLALAGVGGALVTAEASFWQPLAVALPLAGIAIYADAHSRGRTLTAELAGAIAMGATVAMIVLAHGWEPRPAFGLWLVLVGRAAATIPLVRAQIRRVHERPAGARAVYVIQAATVVAMIVAALLDLVPWLSVGAIAVIGFLAYLSLQRPPVAAKTVGWTQILVGLGVVLLTAVGVWIEW